MTTAVWRTGGWAVRTAVIVLTAQPLNRLTAQTEGSVLTVLPGSTRSAALGGAGAALVGDAGAPSHVGHRPENARLWIGAGHRARSHNRRSSRHADRRVVSSLRSAGRDV